MERELLLLYTMAVFTGVAAIALLIQMGFLFGIFRALQKLQKRTTLFLDHWEPLADTSRQRLEEVSQQTSKILGSVEEITDSAKNQTDKVDRVMDELSDVARVQIERLDRTVEDTVHRLSETVVVMQKTVLIPLRQVRGLAAAVSAIMDSLAGRRRRSTVDRVTLDEEMFI